MAELIDFFPDGRYFKAVIIAPVLCFIICLNFFGRNSLHDAYLEFQVNARIVIVGRDHDYPLVRRKNDPIESRPFDLYAPGPCRQYVASNDSVVKAKGSNEIKIVRDSLSYRVTTIWVEDENTSPTTPIERRVLTREASN